ncbi:DUF5689 domain-containing protein [Flavobacteriaceae bacterium S356]|uniref:DUF5689 domain-containing protein n=1 Tax=Asprobacillus argus TaxID=3076534 RepID=A0ABU3LFP2_9FLAO|nr:DUF5689 domain-containing protein [Flavobacteriaceae bacterium S356]
MKTNKFLNVLMLVAFIGISVSCVEDGDFDVPSGTEVQEPIIPQNALVTFQSAINSLINEIDDNNNNVIDNGENGVFTYPSDDPNVDGDELYTFGYVISSDRAGNFFEELIIQNSIDGNNPTNDVRLGFKVEVNVSSLFQTYQTGRKIYIKLNDLSIGISNGVYTIGKEDGNNIGQIQPYEYQDFITRSNEVATMTPKVTTIANLSAADLNTLIQLDNMQFFRDQLLLTYAGEPSDQFDGFRTLESCDDGSTILLQSSTFSDFKSIQVDQNKGNIQGIFSRDFGDDFNVFIINGLSDINFANTDRCDPIELDCGIATAEGPNTLFEDDFQSQTTFSPITGNGWTNFIQEGTEGWEAYVSGGANASLGTSARVGSFQSGDASSVAWLISPAIDFDAQTGETLTFQTSNSFADGSTMDLLFSTDWDGNTANITSATWGILPAAYIVQDSDFFGAWLSSGIVDLSCATGTMHIAFRYKGSGDSGFDGTYELDEIKIKSN